MFVFHSDHCGYTINKVPGFSWSLKY